ncbi:hypothetical protein [Pontibacter fetidus]|uniref:Type 1 periplasmic binding fold superfamily protein n=1 Tax=Pontibacter fetidus TaxID=2700082 RepID=A0A6B2H7I7_9BACT|nr:hypothetical protein [Pontibacter fetidus]NDK56886.1 hypothetical protein [Pontibacter fetidus]
MKKFLRPYLAFLLMGSLLTTTGCGGDDDPKPAPDNEEITTVTLTLEPESKGQLVAASSKDLDGVGGNAPVKTPLTLKPNTTYLATLTLLNENVNPPVEVHKEVKSEANDHQVFYTPSAGSLMTVTVTDKDAQNRPLGLAATIVTGAAGTGKLKVVLKHQKGTKAAAPGDATKGETDVEVEFDVMVQQ